MRKTFKKWQNHFVKIFCLWEGSNFGFEAIVFKLWQNRCTMISRRIFVSAKIPISELVNGYSAHSSALHFSPYPELPLLLIYFVSFLIAIHLFLHWLFLKNKENLILKLWRDKPFKTWRSLEFFCFLSCTDIYLMYHKEE